MSFIEFLGFIISLAAMIFLTSKRFMEERKRRLNPEEYARKEEQQEENLRRFLKSINVNPDDEEEFSPPPEPGYRAKTVQPPPHQALIRLREVQKIQAAQPKKTPQVQPGNYGSETASDKKRSVAAAQANHPIHHDLKPADSYEVIRTETLSSGIKLIDSLKASRDMLIIKEIFDKPLCMREPNDNRW